jgi:hypothetical protein
MTATSQAFVNTKSCKSEKGSGLFLDAVPDPTSILF